MNYYNIKLLKQKGLTPIEVTYLQLIKQNRTEDVSELLVDCDLDSFEQRGLVTYIKGKPTDSSLNRVRLSSKGKKWLTDIETPEVTEGDLKMAEYLMEMYIKMSDDEERTIGNKKKVKMYCAVFRQKLQLTLHEMFWLCYLFVEEYEFTKVLEKVFIDSNKNRYGNFESNIEDSKLYQFYDNNKEKILDYWKQKIK